MTYLHWLLVVSAAMVVLERLFPWRKGQALLRPGWLRDLAFLLLNGHVFGILTAGLSMALYGWSVTAACRGRRPWYPSRRPIAAPTR